MIKPVFEESAIRALDMGQLLATLLLEDEVREHHLLCALIQASVSDKQLKRNIRLFGLKFDGYLIKQGIKPSRLKVVLPFSLDLKEVIDRAISLSLPKGRLGCSHLLKALLSS